MATIGPFAKKMKVKVSLNNVGLVIPIPNPKERVSKLFAEVAHRFEAFGVKPGELRIAELRTIDNFWISPRDVIEEVIEDGSTLIAVDFDTWLVAEEKNCTTEWLQVLREDYEDEVPKWISVGFHKLNKVWVKFGTGWTKSRKTLRLEIFDIDGLKYFSKDGPVLIGAQESGPDKKWTLEANFIVQKGTAKEIQVAVKSTTDKKPVIKSVGLVLNANKISQGEIHTVQEVVFNYDPSKYTVPKAITEGPVLTGAPEEEEKEEKKPEPVKSLPGDIPLEAVYEGLLEIDQGWSGSNGFPNYFYINLSLVNRGTEAIPLSKMTVEYLTKENKWKEVDESAWGRRNGWWNYSWSNSKSFNVDAKSKEEMAIKAVLMIKEPTFTPRRRAHISLPSPLKFRITFEDLDGKKISIEIAHVNTKPLSLPTKESVLKENSYQNPVFYAQCDDPKLEGRIFAVAAFTNDNKYFSVKTNDKNLYIYPSTLAKNAFLAVKEKKKEIPCADLTSKPHELCPIEAYYLVDLDNQLTYGMKFVLKTTTGKTESSFVFPKLPESK